MKALILNSGMGSRMGVLASEHPKCMTEINTKETILSRQLRILVEAGINEIILTTGYHDNVLTNYCQSLDLPIQIVFVNNPQYRDTNYIYSIYCAKDFLDDDIILMHGDLVFENEVFDKLLEFPNSCMIVSSTVDLPEKDFKAVIHNEKIEKIGVQFFNKALAAQPLYKLHKADWRIWREEIVRYCESNDVKKKKCYAEDAFNEISEKSALYPLDIKNLLCSEIDNSDDLAIVLNRLKEINNRIVYMSFSTDIIHSAHINILKKAARLGKVIIGVLSDEAVASYKRYPLLPYSERKTMFENIAGVYKVVEQDELSYRKNLLKYKPDYVVHGDNWRSGFLRPIRNEVTEVLASYGGKLVEFPYAEDLIYKELEARTRAELAMPDIRRGRLKRMLEMKGLVTAMEAHDGLTGVIVENTVSYQNGGGHQFDAIWVSSLCDSTTKGKPDIELVDLSSRFRTVEDLMEVTTKPIIFDGDTGGRIEHFAYTVRSLERMGVSMVIIEDKTGLKKNSLFGTEVKQEQDSVENFAAKLSAGKRAQKTQDFMICARVESLILEQGMEDALKRAESYVNAGADAIMIHSRKEDPDEVYSFMDRFRKMNENTPLIVVPTSYNSATEEELKAHGANVVIYANQLMRAAVPAMQNAARMILEHHRAKECDSFLMPFSDIIRMIPEEC